MVGADEFKPYPYNTTIIRSLGNSTQSYGTITRCDLVLVTFAGVRFPLIGVVTVTGYCGVMGGLQCGEELDNITRAYALKFFSFTEHKIFTRTVLCQSKPNWWEAEDCGKYIPELFVLSLFQ